VHGEQPDVLQLDVLRLEVLQLDVLQLDVLQLDVLQLDSGEFLRLLHRLLHRHVHGEQLGVLQLGVCDLPIVHLHIRSA
jgi:hypothetical protein